jgi:uncharacterized protein YjbI with pentapeptide repeats
MIQIKHRSTGNVIKEVDATSLANADLGGADLLSADLELAYLRRADLRDADLQDANLQYTNLQDTKLQRASLQCANLIGANLQYANLQGANLQNAVLQDADLQNTDLRGAYLEDADIRWMFGDGKRIKTIDDRYRIVIMPEYGVMAIGCEQHSIAKWMNFSDEEIDKMADDALHWWKAWKPRIQQLIVG